MKTQSSDLSSNEQALRARFDRFELDEANARLLCNGQPVALARRPFALLCALVRRPGKLLTKNALLDEVWGHRFVSDSGLKSTISELRTVLDDDVRQPRFIETVSRRGYRFVAVTLAVGPSTPDQHAAQSSLVALVEVLPCLRAALNQSCSDVQVVACVRNRGTSSVAGRCDIPQPVYATSEQVRYAQELWLTVRARLLSRVEPVNERAPVPAVMAAN